MNRDPRKQHGERDCTQHAIESSTIWERVDFRQRQLYGRDVPDSPTPPTPAPAADPAAGVDPERQRMAALVRAVTLIATEVAFAGVFAYVMYETWGAPDKQPPTISGPVEGVAGALAVALAAGFAGVLGTHPSAGTNGLKWFTKANVLSTEFILFIGVFLYMTVGAACGLTYLANTDESPGLLRTVSVAFGGYVIAYIGSAYRQLST